jgi:hypothetical protein
MLELVTSCALQPLTDLERFQCLASETVTPRIQSDSSAEADKAAREHTVSASVAYGLSTIGTGILHDLHRPLEPG